MQISKISYNNQIYNQTNVFKNNKNIIKPSFEGKKGDVLFKKKGIFAKKYDSFTNWLAKKIVKTLEKSGSKKLIERTNKDTQMRSLLTITSIILSGFYVKKTLESEHLDKQKRTTLAINQGATAILSAIIAYTADGYIKNAISNYKSKFEKVNKGDVNLAKYTKGIDIARSVIVFGTIYRFISPVFVTPIANKLGDMLQQRKIEKQNIAADKNKNEELNTEAKFESSIIKA